MDQTLGAQWIQETGEIKCYQDATKGTFFVETGSLFHILWKRLPVFCDARGVIRPYCEKKFVFSGV